MARIRWSLAAMASKWRKLGEGEGWARAGWARGFRPRRARPRSWLSSGRRVDLLVSAADDLGRLDGAAIAQRVARATPPSLDAGQRRGTHRLSRGVGGQTDPHSTGA